MYSNGHEEIVGIILKTLDDSLTSQSVGGVMQTFKQKIWRPGKNDFKKVQNNIFNYYKHIHILQTHVDTPDKFSRTPLHIAAMNNKVGVVKLLMERYY